METEKNIYGLSEGVFKACLFLGLQFPSKVPAELQFSRELFSNTFNTPSDYFGKNFKLTPAIAEKLQAELQCSRKQLSVTYKAFADDYLSRRCFKHTTTDLNVYFCDYLLFVARQQGAIIKDYFNFEFYRKSFELRNTFLVEKHVFLINQACNDYYARDLVTNKSRTNRFFTRFLHRDWLDACDCSFEEFKVFVEKHPRFFSKPVAGLQGLGAQIFKVNSNTDLEKFFSLLKNNARILEEIVIQHKSLQEFCPDTVNTVRVNTFLDVHNVVHILTTTGKFGRIGNVIDNVHEGGGCSVIIDPKTGIVISDGISNFHERWQRHPDTGKTFKGFQYPCWEKLCTIVTKMAIMIPSLRHIGWDIAINDKNEALLIEANAGPDVGLQQIADNTGRLHLYVPLLNELWQYKISQMKTLGWRVNNLPSADSAYNPPLRSDFILKFVISKLIPDCASLIDLGCRKAKLAKSLCPERIKYYPVDFKKHDAEVIACNFNEGDFPDIKADTCLCALTAEYVELLPQFLNNMCTAAQKQVLMLCRPVDKERNLEYRWNYPFLTDFTEEFLLKTMAQNNFRLDKHYLYSNNQSLILYDFRRMLDK